MRAPHRATVWPMAALALLVLSLLGVCVRPTEGGVKLVCPVSGENPCSDAACPLGTVEHGIARLLPWHGTRSGR